MKYKSSKSRSRTRYKAIITVITCTLLTAIAQVLLKYATTRMSSVPIYANIPLIAGLVTYAFASVLLIIALRNADLSLIYPFIALSFIWVALLSIFLFNEHVSLANTLGIISVIIGVSLIGRGGRK